MYVYIYLYIYYRNNHGNYIKLKFMGINSVQSSIFRTP